MTIKRSPFSPAAPQKPRMAEIAPGSAETASENLLLAYAAECIGTLLLVLVGTAVATAAVLSKATAGPAYDSLGVALSFGLILIPIAGSLGQISGAHVNPAVTLGLAVAGKFAWKNVVPYWLAQMIGAIFASLLVWAAYGHGAYAQAHLGLPSPENGASGMQVLLVEALIAFILVFTVISTTTDKRVSPGIAAICIGFALSAGVLLGGPGERRCREPPPALWDHACNGNSSCLVFLYHRATSRRRRRCAHLSAD